MLRLPFLPQPSLQVCHLYSVLVLVCLVLFDVDESFEASELSWKICLVLDPIPVT